MTQRFHPHPSVMRSGELCDFITQSLKASDSKLNAMDRYIQRAKDRFEAKENSH